MQRVKAGRATSGSRRVFTQLFSFPRYVERLGDIAGRLLTGAPHPVQLAPALTIAPVGRPETPATSRNGAYGGEVVLH
jgi:hypothetical protein